MVKTRRVGKKRPFWRGLFLTVVTLGVYGVYWAYKAPHELYDQFDLHEEGLDEGIPWLVVGLVVPVILFVYFWKAVGNIEYARRRLSLDPGVTPGRFVGAQIAGGSLPAVLIVAVISASSLGAAAGEEASLEMVGEAVLGAFLVLLIAGQLVVAHAYYLLQTSINATWDAWYHRVRELKAQAAAQAAASVPW